MGYTFLYLFRHTGDETMPIPLIRFLEDGVLVTVLGKEEHFNISHNRFSELLTPGHLRSLHTNIPVIVKATTLIFDRPQRPVVVSYDPHNLYDKLCRIKSIIYYDFPTFSLQFDPFFPDQVSIYFDQHSAYRSSVALRLDELKIKLISALVNPEQEEVSRGA